MASALLSRSLLLAVLFGTSAAVGCGDDDGTATGSGGGSGGGDATTGPGVGPGAGGGDPTVFSLACEAPEPILQPGGEPSGYETCDDGFRHRADAVTCELPTLAACDTGEEYDTCETSADCTEQPFGFCVAEVVGNPPERCGCVYGCETDADCAAEEVCSCAGVSSDIPRCIPAGCHTSADCGGGLCGLDVTTGGCGNVSRRLACLTEASECRDLCPPEATCYDELAVPPCEIRSGAWECNEDALCQDCG
jgi:hypothetical protein